MSGHELGELLARHLAGAEGLDHHRGGFGDANGVGDLHLAAVGEARRDDILGHVARGVGGRAVDLGGVLAGEGAAAVTGEAAVGVDDDLAAREAAVTHRAANDEATGRVDVELGALVQPLLRQHRQQDFLGDRLAQLLGGDVVAVLRGEHHRLDGDRTIVLVAQRDLTLGVRAQPGQLALLAHLGLALDEPMRQRDGRRHEHVSFVGGEAEHQALIACTLLARVAAIDTLSDVSRLFADDVEYAAGGAIKAHFGRVVTDAEHGLAHDAFDVDPGVGGDLARDDRDAGLDQRFDGDAAALVLLQNRIEDGVGNLVGDLVRMPFGNRLGGKQVAVGHGVLEITLIKRGRDYSH